MSEAWKKVDLGGGGLQSLNLELMRRLKRRPLAYMAWLAFPLGVHRLYLGERWGALVYVALTVLTVVLALGLGWVAAAPAGAAIAFAIFDLFWIERRLPAVNKAIRKSVYLGHGADPPAQYRGRFADDEGYMDEYVKVKESERPDQGPSGGGRDERPSRAPSFQEQEQMLREMQRRRKDRSDSSGGSDDGSADQSA